MRVDDPVDGTRWRIDAGFLASSWRCRWDDGCLGILDEASPELGQGCCSLGAELLDDTEAATVAALAATIPPERFERHAEAAAGGVLGPVRDAGRGPRHHTRVVGGACVFWNRPDFPGGHGCALHLAALDDGDDPIDWKPSVCWQLPLKVDVDPDGTRTLRRWRRDDWGPGGTDMAWCCTRDRDDLDAYAPRGEDPAGDDDGDAVVDSMGRELEALVGTEVAVEIRDRIRRDPG